LRLALSVCCGILILYVQSAWAQTAGQAGSQATGQTTGQTTDPQSLPFTIEVNVNKVLVPVVVRDSQGRAVSDLKKEDFQLFANDKPQLVSGFSIQKRSGAGNNSVSGKQPSVPESTAPQSSVQPQRFIVFLFDDMHMSAEDLAHAMKAGSKVLADTVTGRDIAAVVTVSGKTNSGLTRDRARLNDALKSILPRGIYRSDGTECPNIDYYQADQIENKHNTVALDAATQQVFTCSPGLNPQRDYDLAVKMAESTAMRTLTVGHQDVQTTYAAIGGYVRSMASLPGQRTLILVSPGFLSVSQEERTEESRIMDIAAESIVTISALDARGLYTTELDASEASPGSGRMVQLKAEYRRASATQSENPLSELADATGGTYFHNSNDLDAGFRRLAEAPECVYVLELSLDGVKPDGAYHRLKVKVDREGVQLQARHGYFAPKTDKHKH